MPDADYSPPAVARKASKRPRHEPASAEAGAPTDAEGAPPAAKRPGAKQGTKYLAGEQKKEVLRRCDELGVAALASPLPKADCEAWAATLRAQLMEDDTGRLLRAACTADAVERCVNNYRKSKGWAPSAAAAPASVPGTQRKARKPRVLATAAEQAAAKATREASKAAEALEAAAVADAAEGVRRAWDALVLRAAPFQALPVSPEQSVTAAALFSDVEKLFNTASNLLASPAAQTTAVAAQALLYKLATTNAALPWAAAWNAGRTVLPGTVPVRALGAVELPPIAAPSGTRLRRKDVPQRRTMALKASRKATTAMLREAGTAVHKSSMLGCGVLDAAAAAAAATRHGFVVPPPAAGATPADGAAAPAPPPLPPLNGGAAFACYVSPDGQLTSSGFNFPAACTAPFIAFMRELLGAPPAADRAAAARHRMPFTSAEVAAQEEVANALGTAAPSGAEEGTADDA